jgi:hypothetical protein
VRRLALAFALVLCGCGGSTAGSEPAGSDSRYSADDVVACLRDDEGLLVPEDDVLEIREGFAVEDPAYNESLRLDREDEPEIRGDFTIVRWYGDVEELSKVQLYFAPTEEEAVRLREEFAANDRAGGALDPDLSRNLERRRNLVLTWDQGATTEMREQIARCTS